MIAGILPSFGLFDPYEELVIEWAMITGISFMVTVLAIVIRGMIPAYARYPLLFSFLPLLIIALYPFINDAQILKDLVNQILQGGTIFVGFVFYITLIDKVKNHWVILLGLIGLLTAYLMYWFTGELGDFQPWTWHVPLALSTIPVSYKLAQFTGKIKE